jgi:redox-sensing transcriptional repressor
LKAIRLAILCVPADSAQRVADLLIASGIQGILNFAPIPLVVPPSVNVMAVDLSVQLENLAYKVLRTQSTVPRASASAS